MISSEQQYVIIFSQAQQLERDVRRLRAERENEEDSDRCYQLLAQMGGLKARRDQLQAQLDEWDKAKVADRKGSWMGTFTGRRFWLLDPRPEDIDIRDIAHGLSRISRYNGATMGKRGYTVAQHSVVASWIVARPYRLATLLHDAPEAYAGDVITPLKRLLGKTYQDIEDGIMQAIALRFGVALDEQVWKEIHWADRVMLVTEVRDLLPLPLLITPPVEEPLPLVIRPWSQQKSRKEFMQRFAELTGAK